MPIKPGFHTFMNNVKVSEFMVNINKLLKQTKMHGMQFGRNMRSGVGSGANITRRGIGRVAGGMMAGAGIGATYGAFNNITGRRGTGIRAGAARGAILGGAISGVAGGIGMGRKHFLNHSRLMR